MRLVPGFVIGVFVFLPAAALLAEDIEGWEIPDKLKGEIDKPCPAGMVRDAEGWCVKPPEGEPKPSPAPGTTPPAPDSTPPGASPPRPGATTPAPGATPPGASPPRPGATPPAPGTAPPGSTPPGASPPRPGATPPGATPPSPGASPPGASPPRPGATPPSPGASPPGTSPPRPGATPPAPGTAPPGSTPPGASPPRPGATPPGATPPSPGASPPGATPLPPGASPAPGSEGAPEPKTGKAETGEPGKEGEAKADEQSSESFVKGELSSFIGATKLATKNNRIGVCLGYKMLDLVHYATITPEADLRFGKLTFGLGVPLALQVFDGNLEEGQDASEGFDDAGAFRTEDWDEPGEYVRFIRYLTWGRKEDNIYFSLSQLGSNSLGHGALARRYSVNIDPNSARVAGQLDMYNDYAGFEFMVNSIVDWEIFGALGFVKPLSFFLDNEIARSLSIGFTYMADRAAPVSLVTQSDPANPFFIMGKGRPDVASDAFLHAMGVDVEIKVLRTDTVDIKPFIDISWMLPGTPSGETPPDVSGGNGFTLGLLGRFSFGAESVHALRIIAELRSFSSNYMPGYFDTFYEVQKYAVSQDYKKYAAETGALPPTKFYEIFHNRRDGDRKWGFYLEFSYALIGKVSLTLALEGSDADYGNHFLAHLEVPALDWLQFFASFHQRAMPSVGDIFSLNACDKVLFTAVRLKLLPFLFVNFRYHFTLGLREQYADLTGDGFENHYRFYEPYHGIMGDVEFGWEF